jgi:hypothetical protein
VQEVDGFRVFSEQVSDIALVALLAVISNAPAQPKITRSPDFCSCSSSLKPLLNIHVFFSLCFHGRRSFWADPSGRDFAFARSIHINSALLKYDNVCMSFYAIYSAFFGIFKIIIQHLTLNYNYLGNGKLPFIYIYEGITFESSH